MFLDSIRESRKRYAGPFPFVLVIGLSLMAANTLAVRHTISSLPYTCSLSNDTLTISGDLRAADRAITISGDIRNVYIWGGGHTITFNTAGSSRVTGILIGATNGVVIENLTVVQNSAVGDSCVGIRVATSNTKLIDCNVHVKGRDCRNVWSEGAREVEIRGGNYTSFATEFYSREFNLAACLHLENKNPAVHAAPYEYMYWVHGITIDSCPHIGIVADGLAWVDSNFVRVDARNDLYTYPSGDMMHGTGNAYAIGMDFIVKGARATYNTIRSGTNHKGGRGMYVGRAMTGTTVRGWEVAYNDIDISEGPDAYYGTTLACYGIRMRSYSIGDSCRVHHNRIRVQVDNDPSTDYRCVGAIGLFIGGPGNGNQIYNNRITAVADTNGSYADRVPDGYCYAIAIEKAVTDVGNISYNNYFASNVIPFKFGEINANLFGAGCNWVSTGDTIHLISPSFTDQWDKRAAVGVGYAGRDALNNTMRDPVFITDTSLIATGNGTVEIMGQKTLHIEVVGRNNMPVPYANVTVRNGQGQTVFTGVTDDTGRVAPPVSFHHYRWVGGGSQAQDYNPFTVTARYNTDSATTSVEVDFAFPSVSLQLQYTDGTPIEQDTIPPAPIRTLSVAPSETEGFFTFRWLSTGDDDTLGSATYDSIRFSTSPIDASNWGSAWRYPRTSSPLIYGTPDEVDIAEPVPVPGQFYYVAIKAFDNGNNASPLAFDSGWARGILRPHISSDTLVVDPGGQQLTFFTDVVPSYLEHAYQFQLAPWLDFASPATVDGTISGGYAQAAFPLPPEDDTVFVRCRATALDQSETSPWSLTRAFSLSVGFVNMPPTLPIAISPQVKDTVTSLTPSLIVGNSADPDQDPITYRFEVYDATGTELLASSGSVSETPVNTAWEVPPGTLQDRTAYNWRACGYDGQAYSEWTEPVPFTVLTFGTALARAAPLVYAYPNPVRFTAGEQATFVLPDEPVELTIMTVSGDIVLFRESLTGRWTWNGANESGSRVAVGVYLWYVSGDRGQGKLVVKP